jgi:hypothetical protein
MKGLLLKDLAIVKQQGRSIIIIVAIAIFMMASGNDITFAIAYANILFVMFGITTLNYDAFDNGFSFLFTLPITRKMYVTEKYLFSLMCVVAGLTLSLVLMTVTGNLSSDGIWFIAGYAAAAILLLSLLLPIELKYGPEKGRIAMIIIFAIVFAVVFGLKKVIGPDQIASLLIALEKMNEVLLAGIVGAAIIVLLLISYLISCRIMEKKEF